jgi:hypothetical protein
LDKQVVKACPKCMRLRPLHHDYCGWCGTKLMRGLLELWDDTAGDAGPAERRPGQSVEAT